MTTTLLLAPPNDSSDMYLQVKRVADLVGLCIILQTSGLAVFFILNAKVFTFGPDQN